MAKTIHRRKSKRHFEFSSVMPVQFHLLCKLMEVEPRQVIYDFMCNAGMEGYGLGDKQRATAMEYFINCGYGQHFYSEDDIRKIFKEMESIGSLFPNNGKSKLITIHSSWRKKYYKYWYRKWFLKVRRKK
jgi:hypothetical protein